MDKNRLLKIGLLLSIIINLILVENTYNYGKSKATHLEEVSNGIRFSYEFGDTLYKKFNDLTLDEKIEYLSSMHWTLTMSKWTLQDIRKNDREYIDLLSLLIIYSHIPTELTAMIRQNKSEEEVLTLLETWLKDMEQLKDELNNTPLSKMNNKELNNFLKSLQLNYPSESVELFKKLLD